MKKTLVAAFLLLFLLALQIGTPASVDDGWSKTVNGLQARLRFVRTEGWNGTPFLRTYLEFQNAGVWFDVPFKPEAVEYEVVDDQNNLVKADPSVYDEVTDSVQLGIIRLPADSLLRFNVSRHGAGIPKNQGAVLDLGPSSVWIFRRGDKRPYYLRARFSAKDGGDRLWSGTVEIPRIKLPTSN